MKLTDLHLDEFGTLRNLSLPSLSPGFSGLYGPNGSGKTTLLYFLRGAMGDKSDALAARLWQHTDRHCGSIGVQAGAGRGSHEVTIRGGLKTKRELLDSPAAARLATLVSFDSSDTAQLLNLADRLGLDVRTQRRDRDAEHAYEVARDDLSGRIASLVERLPEARRDREVVAERHRRLQVEWQRASERLRQQRHDVRAAVRSADAVTAFHHAEYQRAQTDLTEWQRDAWRPRRVDHTTRSVTRRVESPRTTSTPTLVRAGGSQPTIEAALTEIARLRCQAAARRLDGYAAEADRCGCEHDAARRKLEVIRHRLDEGGSLETLAGDLVGDLQDLAGLLDRHESTLDWLRADRAIALLDRAERDLLRVRGTLEQSVCGTTVCRTETPLAPTYDDITEEVVETHIEPPADAAIGRRLADQVTDGRSAWQAAQRQATQVRRHLARIEGEIARLQEPDLLSLEAQLEALAGEIEQLGLSRQRLQAELDALVRPDSRGPNPILDSASDYFRRMTCDHYRGLRLKGGKADKKSKTETGRLVAVTAGDVAIDARTLSQGTRGQAALSLRLALLDAVGDTHGTSWPLVLDDALVESDHERMAAGVTVLRQWAADRGGRQVLLMTCQRQLIEALHAQQVPLRTLPGGQLLLDQLEGRHGIAARETARVAATAATEQPRPIHFRETAPTPAAVLQTIAPRRTVAEPTPSKIITFSSEAVSTEPVATRRGAEDADATSDRTHETTHETARETASDSQYWLSLESPLRQLPSLDNVTARRLSTIELATIDDLLKADADALEDALVRLQLHPEWFRRWQREARLLVTVPQLAARDGQLLAFLEIDSGAALATLTVADLETRIAAARRQPAGGRPRIDWDGLSSHRLGGWIARAGRGRSLARRESRRSSRDSGERRAGRSSHRASDRGEGTLTVIQRRRAERRSSESSRESSTTRGEGKSNGRSSRKPEGKPREWKHYLAKSSPVVDAPSIGPKMAKRLHKLGIRTVADLLAATPAKVAKQLDDRRVTAQTVSDWIDQSRLMCRIPLLRGHDAQVLVAVGYRTLGDLEGLSAKRVFEKVGPFVRTKEGQRLLRSSRTPDLEEVGDWLVWASHARPLKAA